MANGKCRRAGGKSLKGPASPRFKTGADSDYIKLDKMREIYEQLAENGFDPFAADHDLRLLMSRQRYLTLTGESRDLWLAVKDWWKQFKEATTGEDANSEDKIGLARAALAQLDQLINQGEKESQRWAEVYEVTEKLDRVRDRAFKRLVEAEHLVRTDKAIAMFGQFIYVLQHLIIEYVTQQKIADAALLDALIGEWDRIMGAGHPKLIGAGPGRSAEGH